MVCGQTFQCIVGLKWTTPGVVWVGSYSEVEMGKVSMIYGSGTHYFFRPLAIDTRYDLFSLLNIVDFNRASLS